MIGADDAERRQDHDVDLGVAEEPEDVLVHHRVAAAGRVEEAGAEVAVGQRHRDGAGQHRHHRDQQVGGDQPGPAEQRHLHQRHARRAHVQDGDDDVDRAHDRTRAHDVQREDAGVHRRAHLQRQRRVERPAGRRRAAGHEERHRPASWPPGSAARSSGCSCARTPCRARRSAAAPSSSRSRRRPA